jgi:membrane protease YdiL (CAAX protease family)
VVFLFMSVTAGIVEELLYRGFGMAVVTWAVPGATNLQRIWFTAAAFGFAHVYQSVFGVISTGVLGAWFAWLTLATGSLVPAMILHMLIDVRFCLIPANYVEAL